MMTKTDEFDFFIKEITQKRGAIYGHPLDDFAIAQMIKDAVCSCPNTEVRHALEMIGVKMARLCTTPSHTDSVIDIAGYARTIVLILDEKERRDAVIK
tara:strand:- start:233 stop:526 length:294 start_codon:yes stop_codon:yes gene_type:complete